MVLGPANTTRIGWFVILALHHVLWTSVIEAKHCVIHIFANRHNSKALAEIVTGLCIHLRMRVEVVIAEWTRDAEVHSARSRALVLIGIYIRAVMRNTECDQGTLCRVGRPYIPGVWSLSNQSRVIGTASDVVVS